MDFENLSQDEKTAKLQMLFIDKVNFCKNHGIRRAIVRVLDPGSFTFSILKHLIAQEMIIFIIGLLS